MARSSLVVLGQYSYSFDSILQYHPLVRTYKLFSMMWVLVVVLLLLVESIIALVD
jgi:hypothetical protein